MFLNSFDNAGLLYLLKSSILFSAMGMLMLAITVPALIKLFSFEFPGYRHFISSFIGAMGLLCIFETTKWLQRKKMKR